MASLTERQLEALAEIGQAIAGEADYESVLAALIERVTRLLGARGGGFMLYDEESGELVTQRPAFGLPDELVEAYRVPVSGGGNAASAFVTGEAYFTNDAREDPRVIRRFAELHGISKLLTVPLRIEGRSIGVYHAIDKQHGEFGPEDVELMRPIAPQLAVVIRAAATMRALREREERLGRALAVHEALTEMLLGGASLAAMVERIAQLLGMPTLLTDAGGRPLSGDAAGPGEGGDGERLVVPVQAGGETLGELIARPGPGGAGEDDLRVMQQAAVLLALELLRERQIDELHRRVEADVLEHLFAAADEREAAQLLERLGVATAPAYRAAIVAIEAADPAAALAGHLQATQARAGRQLRGLLAELGRPGAVVEREGAFWLLVPQPADAEPEADRAAFGELARRVAAELLGRRELRLAIGVGEAVASPRELRGSFAQAEQTVEICRRGGPSGGAVFFADLGVYRLLAQPAGSADLDRYAESVLGPLLRYDEENEASWLEFLAELAAANFGASAAAARAGLHLNTVKYRIGRIQELLGRDFADASDRFDVQLALRILEFRREAGG